jgi:hypothetical protein
VYLPEQEFIVACGAVNREDRGAARAAGAKMKSIPGEW